MHYYGIIYDDCRSTVICPLHAMVKVHAKRVAARMLHFELSVIQNPILLRWLFANPMQTNYDKQRNAANLKRI